MTDLNDRTGADLLRSICAAEREREAEEARRLELVRRAAPDYLIYGRAITAKVIRWEPFVGKKNRGEICLGGLRYSTELDQFGVPVLTGIIRAAIARAEGRSE